MFFRNCSHVQSLRRWWTEIINMLLINLSFWNFSWSSRSKYSRHSSLVCNFPALRIPFQWVPCPIWALDHTPDIFLFDVLWQTRRKFILNWTMNTPSSMCPREKGAIIILDHIWRSIQSREVNFYECIILHCLKKSKVQPTMFDSFLIFSYFGRERFSKPRKGEFGGWAFIRWER